MDFLFIFLFLTIDMHNDVPLYVLVIFLLLMATCTLVWGYGRRRERDLFLFTAVSRTKVREWIRKIFKWRALVALCHSLLVDKSLWWRGYDFLATSVSICRTALARRSTSRALK